MRVVERNTSERKMETVSLFNQVKPLLEKGYSYNLAVKKVKNLSSLNTTNGWFKELVEYGESQGYLKKDYKSKKGRRKYTERLD